MEDLVIENAFAPEVFDNDNQGVLDNDNQGDAGNQPHRTRKYYTLWDKKDIIQEAYVAPRRIRVAARKYGVQPKQIRRWRNDDNALTALPQNPNPRTVDERGTIKKAKENKMQHKGRSFKISPDYQEHIIDYYEQLRDRRIPVSSHSLEVELLCVTPEMNDVPVSVLR
jgi:transposase-like protein